MKSSELTAERNIHAIAPDGTGFEIHLLIGRPYKISEDEWGCTVGLEGLHSGLRDQHGIDSWHALKLAYQLIMQLLGYFIDDGGQLYWEEGGGSISLSELAPVLPAF